MSASDEPSSSGVLLIADITGYTAYLSGSELEHARGTLTDLLELLIDHTRPPLAISRLEGDAVISYAIQLDMMRGQPFVEMVEETYVAFRRAIELMVLNNTCRCNACANVSNLDLKFFVHHGSFLVQRLGTQDELLGTDVNLVHRLLKNTVVEATGIRAYTLYTIPAIEALGLGEMTEGMTRHEEPVADFGDVEVWVEDMHPVWEARRDQDSIEITPSEKIVEVDTTVTLPPHEVWSYLIEPEYRKTLIGSDRQRIDDKKAGRVAPGSVYQCFHGKRAVPQVILEWRPFERMVTRDLMPLPGGSTFTLIDYQLEPVDGGTKLTQTVARTTGPFKGVARFVMKNTMRRQFQRDIEAFRDVIEEHHASLPAHPSSPEINFEEIQRAAAASLAGD